MTNDKEPELGILIKSLQEVTSRLELRMSELEDLEPRISDSVVGAQPVAESPPDSTNYPKSLHSILGRLRTVDETQHGSITVLKGFL